MKNKFNSTRFHNYPCFTINMVSLCINRGNKTCACVRLCVHLFEIPDSNVVVGVETEEGRKAYGSC